MVADVVAVKVGEGVVVIAEFSVHFSFSLTITSPVQ